MKKNLFLMFTAMLICGLSFTVLTSCSSSDDNDPTSNIYVYGFDSMNTSDLSEMATIENTFKTAIGVSDSPFTYTQGESKLKSDCEKAGNAPDSYGNSAQLYPESGTGNRPL